MLRMPFLKALTAGAMVIGLGATLALAGPIEDRQADMKAIGKALGALVAIAKKEKPFDAAVVKESADTITAKLEDIKDKFPEGSDKGPPETYAKAEIWTDRAGFEAARMKAHDAAVQLAMVTDEAKFGEAFGALGGGCKGCHEKYRRPKD